MQSRPPGILLHLHFVELAQISASYKGFGALVALLVGEFCASLCCCGSEGTVLSVRDQAVWHRLRLLGWRQAGPKVPPGQEPDLGMRIMLVRCIAQQAVSMQVQLP